MGFKTSLINWSLLMSLVLLWGTSFMFTAVSVETIDPLSLVFFRVVLAAIVLLGAVLVRGQRIPVTVKAWLAFLLMGFLGNLLPFFLISWGQQTVSSGIAGMIMAIMPLITMLLAHYFVQGENLTRYKIIGFAMGITGVTILLGPVFEGGGRAMFSGIAIFIAAASYAVNTILVRRLPSFGPLVGSTCVMIAASITMLPIWYFLAPYDTSGMSLKSINSLIWLGIGPTGIATIILFSVIERAGPTFLSTINYLIPVVAFFTGVIILSEPVEWHSILALATILCGIGLTRIRAGHNPRLQESG